MSVLSSLQLGCVGLAVGTFDETEIGGSSFDLRPNLYWMIITPHDKRYTQAEIVGLWGEPTRATRHGQCDVLVYRDGLNWSGVWAYVLVVPIPIGIPTSSNETRIYLRDGLSVGMVAEQTENDFTLGFMCGEMDCGFLAGRVDAFQGVENSPRHVDIEWCD